MLRYVGLKSHMSGKIPDDRAGILLFADHPKFRRYIGYSPEICPRYSRLYHSWRETPCLFVIGALQFRGLVMSEIHRRRTPTSSTVQIWVFICRERIADHAQKSRRENRNASVIPILQICPSSSQTIGDIYDSRQNLGRSGNSKIPDLWDFLHLWKPGLKGHSYAIWQLYKKLKGVFALIEFLKLMI